jgi:hypothetical protein
MHSYASELIQNDICRQCHSEATGQMIVLPKDTLTLQTH